MSCGSNANKVKKLILAIVLMSWPMWAFAQTYSTSFPLTENPISESGQVDRRTIGRWKSLGQRADERRNGLWRKRTDDLRRPHGDPYWFLGALINKRR